MNNIRLAALAALLLLTACGNNNTTDDSLRKYKRRELEALFTRTEGNYQRERALRLRLQGYIDSTLDGRYSSYLASLIQQAEQAQLDASTPPSAAPLPVPAATPVVSPERLDALEQLLRGAYGTMIPKQGLDIIRSEQSIRLEASDKLMFGSNSAVLSAEGRDFMRSLGRQLGGREGILLTIEGHTDNSPPPAGVADNWDLSVLRATAALREMIEGGMDPSRLRAAGRGPWKSKGKNDSESGRALNRRTEILITLQ